MTSHEKPQATLRRGGPLTTLADFRRQLRPIRTGYVLGWAVPASERKRLQQTLCNAARSVFGPYRYRTTLTARRDDYYLEIRCYE